MSLNIKKGFVFDDVLLIPKYSKIKSRKDVDLSVNLSNNIRLGIPILSANMKNVTDLQMCLKIAHLGGLAVLHRFFDNSLIDQIKIFKTCIEKHQSYENNIAVSIGVQKNDLDFVGIYVENGIKIICLDIAHAHSERAIELVSKIKSKYKNLYLIAGNVATPEGFCNLAKAGADAIKVGIGSGCFAAGTRILLSNGQYKNIENISIGDRVINKDGNVVNVINKFCTGIKRVFKIRHGINSKHTYVTQDHNFLVGDLNTIKTKNITSSYSKLLDKESKTIPKQSKYKWKPINELKRDVFLMPRYINFELNNDFSLDIFRSISGKKNILEYTLKPNYNVGYLFGTFLGDGCALLHYDSKKMKNGKKSQSGSIKWYFGINELKTVEKLSKSIKNIFNKEVKINQKNKIYIVTLYYKPLANILHKFGKKHNKFLPDNLLVKNKEYLQGLIEGLIDSDGHVEKCGRIRISNTSLKINELFNIACYLAYGIFPNNSIKKPSAGGLNCKTENCHETYHNEIIKNGNKRLTKNYQASKLLEVIDTGIDMPVYDLTVDCSSHSFIANNAIVHNSICSTRIETGNGVPQLTALSDCYEAMNNYYPNVKIIADGGIKKTGDIVKALVFSHAVMLGNMLAGSNEAPGEIINIDGFNYKVYAGSSTLKKENIEGFSGYVPAIGPVENVINKILQGIRSGCSYQGVDNLTDLRKDPQFIQVTNAGLVENGAHDILVRK